MNLVRGAIAVLGVLVAATSLPASRFVPPVIRIQEPGQEPPIVTFQIPRYEISPEDRELVAACLVLEAASQGEFGMRAVMSVIRNRARGLPELFALTVLRPRQFSALNLATSGRESLDRAISRARRDPMWATALAIVSDAAGDSWHDPTDGATHYTRATERTAWSRRLDRTVTIGAHAFYR